MKEIEMMRTAWTRLMDEDGANLIEAALILPVVLWIIFATFEFAGILYAQMALQNGVSLATRYAVTRTTMAGKTRQASIIATLNADTPSLAIDPSTITISHLNSGSSTWAAGDGGAGSVEKVSVDYVWHLLTPFMPTIFATNSITLHAESSMKNESDPGT
jgi:Flp pilus assembly protein TadG